MSRKKKQQSVAMPTIRSNGVTYTPSAGNDRFNYTGGGSSGRDALFEAARDKAISQNKSISGGSYHSTNRVKESGESDDMSDSLSAKDFSAKYAAEKLKSKYGVQREGSYRDRLQARNEAERERRFNEEILPKYDKMSTEDLVKELDKLGDKRRKELANPYERLYGSERDGNLANADDDKLREMRQVLDYRRGAMSGEEAYQTSNALEKNYQKNNILSKAAGLIGGQDDERNQLKAFQQKGYRDHYTQMADSLSTQADVKAGDKFSDAEALTMISGYGGASGHTEDEVIQARQQLVKKYGEQDVDEMVNVRQLDKQGEGTGAMVQGLTEMGNEWTNLKFDNSSVGGVAKSIFEGVKAAGGLAGATLATTGANLVKAADLAPLVRDAIRNRPTYSDELSMANITDMTRGNISEALGEKSGIAKYVYNATTSAVDNMINAFMLGEGGLPFMSAQAALSTYNAALNQGKTSDQAGREGVLSGITEWLTEKLPYDNMLDLMGKHGAEKVARTGWEIVQSVVKVAGSEAGEEVTGDIFSEFMDRYLNGDNSEFAQTMQTLKDRGYSDKEAHNIWSKMFGAQLLETGITAALSGALMGGGSSVIGNAMTMKQNKGITDAYEGDVEAMKLLVDEGLKSAEGTNARALAEELSGKLGKGKSLSKQDIINQTYSNEDAIRGEDTAQVEDAVRERLSDLGEENEDIAKAVAKAVTGVELTDVEQKAISNSTEAQTALDELASPELKAASGSWTNKINTNRGLSIQSSESSNNETEKSERYTAPLMPTNSLKNLVSARGESATMSMLSKISSVARDVRSGVDNGSIKIATPDSKQNVATGISEIKSDGTIIYKTGKDTVADQATVTYATQEQAELMQTAPMLNLSVDDTNSVIAAYGDGGMSVENYMSAVSEAVTYGRVGMPMNSIGQNKFARRTLNDTQFRIAYDIGQKMRQTDRSQAVEKSASKTAKRSKGTVSYAKGYNHNASKGERRTTTIRAAEVMAEATGTNVVIYSSEKVNGKMVYAQDVGRFKKGEAAANGFYDPATDTVYLDANAGTDGEGVMAFTAAHEFTHAIAEKAPKEFFELVDFLVDNASALGIDVKGLVDIQRERASKEGRAMSITEAMEEVVADAMQPILTDQSETVFETIQSLKTENKSLWNKLVDFLKKFASKIKSLYSKYDPYTAEGRLVREMGDSIQKTLARLYGKGLVAAGENTATQEMGIEIDSETESANPESFSIRTWADSDYVTARDQAAEELSNTLGISQKKAKAYIDDVNSIAKMIADEKGRLDYTETGLSPFISNAEYGGSFDYTTLCKKRRLLTGTFTAIQNALKNTALTAQEILEIREMMDKAGLEVSCGKCYVEGSRANMGQFTKKFIELYRKYYPDSWYPNMAEMNTPDGIEKVRIEHPEVYEQYEYFWNHYGTLRKGDPNLFASQQKPKLYQMRSAYNGEVLKNFKGDAKIEEKNRNGGIRLQSFSDFEIVHLIDAMQTIMDMSRVGLNGQAYTKVPEFALALGNTGLKINLSIDAWSVDENGKLTFNDKEGMPFETAMRLRDMYSKNVGTICCVYDDAQLLAALADDRIDFIIPFHRSQWKKAQYKAMGLPQTTKDYTYQQNEKWLKPSEHTHEFRGRQVKTKCTNYMPNEYWDFSKSGKENAEKYLEMCARDGKRPKFYKFLDKNSDGSFSLKKDGSTDGYWKLLIDFKMYDNDGVGSPQMPVTPNFNMDECQKMLNEYSGGHQNFPVAQGIVDEFVEKYKKNHPNEKLSARESSKNIDSDIDNIENEIRKYHVNASDEEVRNAAKGLQEIVRRTPGDLRSPGTLRGSGIRTIAKGITDKFVKKGFIDFRGEILSSDNETAAREIATLTMVLRNPMFETARKIYTKGNEIVGTSALTSYLIEGAPTTAKTTWDDVTKDEEHRMKRLGADGYFLLHNHPSGNPAPSGEDIKVTAAFKNAVPGFRGHIVIDHNKFSYIDDGVTKDTSPDDYAVHNINGESQDYNIVSGESPYLGLEISTPDDLAPMVKDLVHGNKFSVVAFASSAGKIRGIQELPNGFVKSKDFQGYISNRKLEFGSPMAFLMTDSDEVFYSSDIESAYYKTLFTDVISLSGDSYNADGYARSKHHDSRGRSSNSLYAYRVNEEFPNEVKYEVLYSTRDSLGNELSKEQQEFFKDVSPLLRDENGNIKPFYHGTARADRVGNYFDPNRATSGPMAYFTDSEEIATNYSRDKSDTSLAYDSEYDSYDTQFRVDFRGQNISIPQLWNRLTPTQKRDIEAKVKQVTLDDDYENIVLDPNNKYGIGNINEYEMRRFRGNYLEALVDGWLNGGTLFGEEERFTEVLEKIGVDKLPNVSNMRYMNPDFRDEKVYATYLNITNPIDTSILDEEFVEDLRDFVDATDMSIYDTETADADMWDKNNIDIEEWISRVEADIENGTTHAWTSIPDVVTDFLKEQGYDGVIDKGGKNGGDIHTVAIPFYSNQIKNIDNKKPTSNEDIRYSGRGNGYDGYSMSNNARRAYANNEKPMSRWTKQGVIDAIAEELGVDPEEVKLNKPYKEYLSKSSWHHTGNKYNKTDFYAVNVSMTDPDVTLSEKAMAQIEENTRQSQSDAVNKYRTALDAIDGYTPTVTDDGDFYVATKWDGSKGRYSKEYTTKNDVIKRLSDDADRARMYYEDSLNRLTDTSYSSRTDTLASRREILTNALESATQNDTEKSLLKNYKRKVRELDKVKNNLAEVENQIQTIQGLGGNVKNEVTKLNNQKNILEKRIENADKKLLDMESMDAMRVLLEREKQKAYQAATEKSDAMLSKQRERLEAREQRRLDKQAEHYQERLKKQAADNRQRTAEKLSDQAEHYQERLKKQTEYYHEKLEDQAQRYRDMAHNKIEKRDWNILKNKILKEANTLNELLLNETKDKHIPAEMKSAVAGILSLFNMDTVGAERKLNGYTDENGVQHKGLLQEIEEAKSPAVKEALMEKAERLQRRDWKIRERLDALKEAYDKMTNPDSDFGFEADPVISSMIEYAQEELKDVALADMSMTQLGIVHDLLKMVHKSIRNANRLFIANRQARVSDFGERVISEVREVGGEKQRVLAFTNMIRKLGWSNLKPIYAFRAIGSNTLTELYQNVRKGEDTWAVDVTEARNFAKDMQKKYGIKDWDMDEMHSFDAANGATISLTLPQMMSVYAYMKREQAIGHLTGGGVVLEDAITKEKKGLIKVSYERVAAKAVPLTAQTLDDISKALTLEQKEYVNEMQRYLTAMGAKGNEVSNELYGIDIFKEENYFPLKSAPDYMAEHRAEKNKNESANKIKNKGFTKQLVKNANNPVVLQNFMDVWASHVNEMSMYHAFTLPLEDFNKVFNYQSREETESGALRMSGVRPTIESAYTKEANEYIRQMLKDINGGVTQGTGAEFTNKMISLFKKGAVFASASVVIQQPSAIARAAALIDSKYLAKTFTKSWNPKTHNAMWEECKKYAPVAIIKEMGYFDTNMGRSAVDWINTTEYEGIAEKAKALIKDGAFRDEFLSKLPSLADEITWTHLWNAVKAEIQDTTDLEGEELLKASGERFTEIVTLTQVYDSTLSRSNLMRSKDTGVKMATSFMAEPTTSLNMMADAVLQGKRQKSAKVTARWVGAVVAQSILNSVLVSLVYASRDDDDKKSWLEKYIASLTGQTFDSLNVLSMIPYVRDIVSVAQGYDVERADMSVISDLKKAFDKASDSSLSPYARIEKAAGAVANIFGLPLKNILRDGRAIYNIANGIMNGPKTSIYGIRESLHDNLPFAEQTTNKSRLLDAYIDGDIIAINRAVGYFKDESTANTQLVYEITDRYQSGEIDEETAIKYLEDFRGYDEYDIEKWQYKQENGTTDGYSKYNDFFAAVDTGKDLRAVIKSYNENGVEASTLSGQITSYYKPIYLEMSTSERAALKGRLLNAYQALGYDRNKKSKDIDKWLKK